VNPQNPYGQNPYPQNPYQAPAPGAQQPYQPPGVPGYQLPGGYEFGETENRVIAAAATWTLILGIITILQAVGNLFGEKSNFINAGLNATIGAFMIGSSMAFRKVVNTQGNDVAHLIEALDKFSTVLIIRIICLILVGVVLLLGVLLVAGIAASR
jgi:hypothetical protein